MLYKKNIKQIDYRKGFLILEILISIGVILVLCTLIYTPGETFLKQRYPIQLKIAAHSFASDIRAIQQSSLFEKDNVHQIIILSGKDGYYIENTQTKNRKYIYFADIGCENVFFHNQSYNRIYFTKSGASGSSGSYILKHKKNTKLSYTITIQVASGRVDLNAS